MTTQITDAMLSVLGGAYTIENVGKIRRLLTAAGVTDVELHKLETERIRHYREQEAIFRGAAETLLAAGPMPPCTCTLNGDGTVESASGCMLGHRRGELPDEVR